MFSVLTSSVSFTGDTVYIPLSPPGPSTSMPMVEPLAEKLWQFAQVGMSFRRRCGFGFDTFLIFHSMSGTLATVVRTPVALVVSSNGTLRAKIGAPTGSLDVRIVTWPFASTSKLGRWALGVGRWMLTPPIPQTSTTASFPTDSFFISSHTSSSGRHPFAEDW